MKPTWTYSFHRGFHSNPALSLKEKGLIGVLADFANMRGEADPTMAQMVAASGTCEKTLWYMLLRLEKKGYIGISKWTDKKGYHRKLFTLKPSCQIYMVGFSKASMSFLHESLQKKSAPSAHTSKSPKIIDMTTGQHVSGWFPEDPEPSIIQETAP